MATRPFIQALYRYPVKGLSPQPLARTTVPAGRTVPADRLYAIENGPTGFDPAHPTYFPKQRFLMLMKNERLAALKTDYVEDSHTLVVHRDGKEVVRGDLRTAEGRDAIERFFATYCADELNGAAKVLYGDGHSFSDVAKKVVSIINLASVAALESVIGAPVDHRRFRANVYVSGWPAWHEFDLMGREIMLGSARVKVIKRIVRCAATNVDPQTGVRDLTIPQTLIRNFDHTDCGVYAEVIADGEIAVGDQVDATAAPLSV